MIQINECLGWGCVRRSKLHDGSRTGTGTGGRVHRGQQHGSEQGMVAMGDGTQHKHRIQKTHQKKDNNNNHQRSNAMMVMIVGR